MLITISRQYGAGGGEVARRVAGTLGWHLVDNEVVERVAALAGLPREDVAEQEERVPTFVERLAWTLVAATPELFPPPVAGGSVPRMQEADLVRITERVVAEMAAEGRVVLVGRAASAVLAGEHDALHVMLVAPRQDRIRTAAARLGVAPEKAASIVDDTDKNRARYHKEYYHCDWHDPSNYHMVLNTSALGLEGATGVVVASAREVWKEC
jgi:cytidylate kinase